MIWDFIEAVYNATVIMAYVSAGLWIIALITNMVRKYEKHKKKR